MSTTASDNKSLLSALDQLLAKYLDEKDESAREKKPTDKYWGTYLRGMKDEDEARPKDWDGNTGSILTFTGLFAATVAAFVVESYQQLSPDSGDQTVLLLSQLLAVTTNSTFNSTALNPIMNQLSTDTFRPPLAAVLSNALWFCSLIVSLACALLATLVQQWSRDYVRGIKQRDRLEENLIMRALNHAYIRMGVDRYGMDGVVNLLVALVHLAVFLFAAGLLLFLFPINIAISWCTASTLGVFGLIYLIAGMLPMFDTSCPYRTPLSYPLNFVYLLFMNYIWTHIQSLKPGPRFESVYRYLVVACASLSGRLRRVLNNDSNTHHKPATEPESEWPETRIFGAGVPIAISQSEPLPPGRDTANKPMLKFPSTTWSRYAKALILSVRAWTRRYMKSSTAAPRSVSNSKMRVSSRVGFLTSVPCFTFIWKHTSQHLLFDDIRSLKTLLVATLENLSLMQDVNSRSAAIQYLWSDDGLAFRLGIDTDDDARPLYGKSDPDTRLAILKLVYVLMQACYTNKELWQEQPYELTHTYHFLIRHHLWTIFSTPGPGQSSIARDDTALPLATSLALFHLRWFLLLKVYQTMLDDTGDSQLDVPQFKTLYFSDKSKEEGEQWSLLYNHQMLENPRALLLLLNSQLYDPIKSLNALHLRYNGSEGTSSCLLPLHDGACCNRMDGPLEHAAACSILTMVSYLLRAPDKERYNLLEDLRQYGKLWEHSLSFTEWDHIFKMSDEGRHVAPSKEFLSILHDAGLDEWLIPGGDLTYLPPPTTPLGKFLAEPITQFSWPSEVSFADILRTLTVHADMSAVRSGLPASYQWLLQTDAASTVPNEGALLPQSTPTAEQTATVHESVSATELGASHSAPRRRGSFDLECVVIDTAVGSIYSQPPRLREVAERARLDDDNANGDKSPRTLAMEVPNASTGKSGIEGDKQEQHELRDTSAQENTVQ